MLRLRIFENSEVRVWLVDEEGSALRELRDPIGGLPRKIDWQRTAESCRVIADEGVEIDLVLEDA